MNPPCRTARGGAGRPGQGRGPRADAGSRATVTRRLARSAESGARLLVAGIPSTVITRTGAGLEHGRRRHVRVIGGAGRLVRGKADIPVTRRDVRDQRKSRGAAH